MGRAPQVTSGRKGISKIDVATTGSLGKPERLVVAHLVTLIGDQRLLVGWKLGFNLRSLGIGLPTVIANDFASDPVEGAFFQNMVKLGGVKNDVEDFSLHKPELRIPITMACSLSRGTKTELLHVQYPKRDVVMDACFIAAILRLLGTEIQQR